MDGGCDHEYAPRPGTRQVFDKLDVAIERRMTTTGAEYVSQNKLLGLTFPEDFTSCDALYWSDGDHFSDAGERRFGARMQLLERLR